MNDKAAEKRAKRFAQIDSLTPDMRALVNEEGWTIVDNFMMCGVRKASQIRHLIALVRQGSGAYGNAAHNDGFVVHHGVRVPRGSTKPTA